MTRRGIFAVAVIAAFGWCSPLSAADAVLRADSFFYAAGAKANKAYGEKPTLSLKEGRSVLLQFDFLTLPLGTIGTHVKRANLWLYAEDVKGAGTFSIRGASNPWEEPTVTGANQPGFNSSVADVLGALVTAEAKGGFLVYDVSDLVRAWLDGAPNSGFMLLADAGSGLDVVLTAREAENANRPRLEIEIDLPVAGAIGTTAYGSGPIPALAGTSGQWTFVPSSKVANFPVAAGEKVLVWASAALGASSSNPTSQFEIGYRLQGSSASPQSFGDYQVVVFPSAGRLPVSLFRSINNLAPGNYEIGLIYNTSASTITNNDYGRCLAVTVKP